MDDNMCGNCEYCLGDGLCKYPICLKEPMSEQEEGDYQKWLAKKYPNGN